MNRPGHLPRLDATAYRGTAWVHWTMTTRDRASGWLDERMHGQVRELLLHTMARYFLHCPGYCVMPDHGHFLWMGLGDLSDQRSAARFFRKHWNAALQQRGVCLQPQAYDHVLRENERRPDAFEDTVIYIFRNPQRAGLVEEWLDWPFRGSILPGYPEIPQTRFSEFWPVFWKIHNRERTKHGGWIEEP
jgi:REP element-mobilizing transposase RayT